MKAPAIGLGVDADHQLRRQPAVPVDDNAPENAAGADLHERQQHGILDVGAVVTRTFDDSSERRTTAPLTMQPLATSGAQSHGGRRHANALPNSALIWITSRSAPTGRPSERPWAVAGGLRVAPLITVTLAADHRASEGHRGGLFLAAVRDLLQNPAELSEAAP